MARQRFSCFSWITAATWVFLLVTCLSQAEQASNTCLSFWKGAATIDAHAEQHRERECRSVCWAFQNPGAERYTHAKAYLTEHLSEHLAQHCSHTHTHTHMQTHAPTYTHTRKHMHTHTRTHTETHIYLLHCIHTHPRRMEKNGGA